MATREHRERIAVVSKTKIRITAQPVRRSRRAIELFQDNRFSPRVVRDRTKYQRQQLCKSRINPLND